MRAKSQSWAELATAVDIDIDSCLEDETVWPFNEAGPSNLNQTWGALFSSSAPKNFTRLQASSRLGSPVMQQPSELHQLGSTKKTAPGCCSCLQGIWQVGTQTNQSFPNLHTFMIMTQSSKVHFNQFCDIALRLTCLKSDATLGF